MGYLDNQIDQGSILAALQAYHQSLTPADFADTPNVDPSQRPLDTSSFDAYEGRVNNASDPAGPLPPNNLLPGGGAIFTPVPPEVPTGAPLAPAPAPLPAPVPQTRPASSPVVPPTQQSKQSKVPALTAIQQADQNENQAINQAGQTQADIAFQNQTNVNNQLGRQATAQQVYTDESARLDAQHQEARLQAHQQAAVETTQWMQKMDTLSNQEPNPHRYWDNQGNFGKSLWLAGMVGSLSSQIGMKGAGMSPNPVIEMLQHSIADDISSQKDRMARQRDNLKVQGDIMQRNQATVLADMNDDYAHQYLRLDSLEKALQLKAQQMNPGDAQQTALLAGANYIGQAKVKVLEKKQEQVFHASESALTRGNAYSIAKMEDQTKNRIANQTDQRERDLAQEKIDAKIAGATKGIPDKDIRTLSRNTGFRIVGPDNKPLTGPNGEKLDEVRMDKDRYESSSKAAIETSNSVRTLSRLRNAIAKTSGSGYLLNTDPELASAIAEAVGPEAIKIHGGGRVSDATLAMGSASLLGVDAKSFWDKVRKGGDREAAIQMLDRKIQEIPNRAAQDIQIHSGISLPPGARIAYTPPPELGPSPEPSSPSIEANLGEGGSPVPLKHPASIEEYRRAKSIETQDNRPGSVLPALPDPLQKEVGDVERRSQGVAPRRIEDFQARALSAITAWEQAQKESPDVTETGKQAAAATAQDAKIRVISAALNAREVSKKQDLNVLSDVMSMASGSRPQSVANPGLDNLRALASSSATAHGLKLSQDELTDLAKRASRVLEDSKGYRPGAYLGENKDAYAPE